jgi:16S rRNA (cytidine1402-2'-O)-methyltransferase
MAGRLFLVPSLLGHTAPEDVLPLRTINIARGLAHYVVEGAKPARHFLKALDPLLPIREIAIEEIGAAPSPQRCAELLAPARAGHDIGLLADAGCPGIADPGALLVAAAHRARIVVVPLVGPSSLLLALMASGMNGQGFAFHGYLPVKAAPRIEAIRRLEIESLRTGQAQLFIETPYRNISMLEALLATCNPATRVAVAADLTSRSETVESRTVREWRERDRNGYDKRPALFILQA